MSDPLKKLLRHNNERQGGLCGQAFTNYLCFCCKERKPHPNTCCPFICPSCEEELRDHVEQIKELETALLKADEGLAEGDVECEVDRDWCLTHREKTPCLGLTVREVRAEIAEVIKGIKK